MPDGSLRDRSAEVIEGAQSLGLDALIGIGGDGSFAILRRLAQQGGLKLVGIPKTIDNDVGATESSIGYNTAVAVATEAIDRLQPTAASHDRVMILEVMGRDAGHIALAAGIAGGADIILIPEIPYTMEAIAAPYREGAPPRPQLRARRSSPRRSRTAPASRCSASTRPAAAHLWRHRPHASATPSPSSPAPRRG